MIFLKNMIPIDLICVVHDSNCDRNFIVSSVNRGKPSYFPCSLLFVLHVHVFSDRHWHSIRPEPGASASNEITPSSYLTKALCSTTEVNPVRTPLQEHHLDDSIISRNSRLPLAADLQTSTRLQLLTKKHTFGSFFFYLWLGQTNGQLNHQEVKGLQWT